MTWLKKKIASLPAKKQKAVKELAKKIIKKNKKLTGRNTVIRK